MPTTPMTTNKKTKRGAISLLLLASSVAAQSLTLTYRGDDGVNADSAVFPVLATGNLVGTLTLETTERELEYVTAYYSTNGHLLFSETESRDARAWFVFRPQDRRLTASGTSPMQFSTQLPIGEQGGAQLPVGTFSLRLWVGRVGAMQYDPITGVPISGYTAVVNTPVTVQGVTYALYVPNPRNIVAGSKVELRVLTSRPVARDVVFRVYPNETLGEIAATQVIIPRGQTCSAGFLLKAGLGLSQGQISVRDDVGTEFRSSMLRLIGEPMARGPNEDEPGIDDYAYCLRKAKWRHFGENEQVCGGCATNPTSPPACQVAPGQSHGVYEKAVCDYYPFDDCELFREQHTGVQTYSASNTFNQSCGATQWHVDVNGQVSGGIGGATGQVGGSVSVSGQTVKYQKCCLVRHGPLQDVSLIQCRTID